MIHPYRHLHRPGHSLHAYHWRGASWSLVAVLGGALAIPALAAGPDGVERLLPAHASQPSQVGIDMARDNGRFVSRYQAVVSGGGTGFLISGNKVSFERPSSWLHVQGEGSSGILARGDDAVITLANGGTVSAGASGIRVQGRQVTLRMGRALETVDPGSRGVWLEGSLARFSGGGIGNVGQSATGILVSGSQADIELKDPPSLVWGAPPVVSTIRDGGTGIRVDGSRASIHLQDTERIQGRDSTGVFVAGTANTLYREGGKSEVLDGGSGVVIQGMLNRAVVTGGTISASGNGTVGIVLRNPDLQTRESSFADYRQAHRGVNNLVLQTGSRVIVKNSAVGVHLLDEYAALADLGGNIRVDGPGTALKVGGTETWIRTNARAINGLSGSIVARGPGASGMAAEAAALRYISHYAGQELPPPLPALLNLGRIDIDPVNLPAGGAKPARPIAARPVNALEFGMSVSRGRDRSTHAVNEGVITVSNAGVAMIATSPGSRVTNQGVINLQATPGVWMRGYSLFGMAALDGATAVNDHTGIINVNSDNAKAFHVDSRSTLLNHGIVNLKGSQILADHVQMGWPGWRTAPPADEDAAQVVNSSPRDLAGARLTVGGVDIGSWRHLNTSTLTRGVLQVENGAIFTNEGTVSAMRLVSAGSVRNMARGYMALTQASQILDKGQLLNDGTLALDQPLVIGGAVINRDGGQLLLSGNASISAAQGAFINRGTLLAERAVQGGKRNAIYVGDGEHANAGALTARGGYGVLMSTGSRKKGRDLFFNSGSIDFTASNGTVNALYVNNHNGHDILNGYGGTITVRGSNAVAMRSNADSQLVNRGVINLGVEGTTDTGMVAMVLGPNARGAAIVNDTSGVINIYARKSHAFLVADSRSNRKSYSGQEDNSNRVLINRGQVNLWCRDNSCGIFKSANAVDVTGTARDSSFIFNSGIRALDSGTVRRTVRSLAGYVIGTRPDGGAGTLSGNHLDASGVTVDTGFAAATTARQASFAKVLRGERIDGIEQIRSRSAAWRAQAYRDADGDVGVTLTKHDYRDLVPQASLRPVAAALERGYDGGELFRSLELGSAAAIGQALHQLSGAGIASTLKPLRTLEQRFVRLEHDMPENRAGFGLRLVGSRHGQPEARLGSSSYDLVALRQRFEFGRHARLTAHYGFASVKPGRHAADAGLDGHSQLFGLHYTQVLGRGPTLEGAFRYAQHRIETRRTLRYGDVDLRPQASQRRDQFSHRLALVLPPLPIGGLALEPLFGLALRHQHDAALTERDAGAYALRLSASHDSAVEGVFGLRFRYDATERRSGRGWRADAELQGRPTLYRQAGVREIRFVTAPGARFSRTETGDRFGYEARLGLGHQGRSSHFGLAAYLGHSDRGVSTRFAYLF